MKPTIDRPDATVWDIHHGFDIRVEQKKNKYGQRLEKVYLYTRDEAGAYYNVTAFAIFSSKFHLEHLLGIKLEEVKNE